MRILQEKRSKAALAIPGCKEIGYTIFALHLTYPHITGMYYHLKDDGRSAQCRQ
jgi:hypothetical protein